jgi:diacylglycerol kinase family enzyme
VSARAFTALVNPIAGGGRAATLWAPVAVQLADADADVRVELTRDQAHACSLAATAAAAGRIVVAVGGDGLVRDVAAGAVSGEGTMAILPAGRGNDLARVLQLPTEPSAVTQLLLHAEPVAVDVIDVGGTIVVGNVYCGIDSVANALINDNRWMPARALYRLAPVRAILTWRAARFALTMDGESSSVVGHSIVVGNSGAYGHGMRIVPSARMDDGHLDVLVVGDGPRRNIVAFMREAQRGTHVHRPEVSVRPAHSVTIDADRPLPVCGDGEQIGSLPVTMRIRPGALRLLMPV